MQRDSRQQAWLESLLGGTGAFAGTVHVQRGDDLYLTAAHNIPPQVIAVVEHVPNGKGMAGLAQVRRAPVQTCNLQEDRSGAIKPGAKAVSAQAAIALPVFDDDGSVRAVVGLAWKDEREISASEQESLMSAAAALPRHETV